jgi:pimeloyl-ACP methyl ester carboxylesterase
MADQYRTIERIGAVKAPLLIIHGGRDAIIPLDLARRVFHAASEPKTMAVVPQAGHNDLFDRGAWERVRGFLDALRPVPVPVPVPTVKVRARGGRRVEIAAAASGEAR